MIEVEWTDMKCKSCSLPLRKAGTEIRCANTNCSGDPAPVPDSPMLDSLKEIDKVLEKANEPTLAGRLANPLKTDAEARAQLRKFGFK